MKPLIEIMNSNYNLNAFEQIEKKNSDLPTFRGEANLKDVFNIKQTQTLLMTEGWQQETPIAFYLAPLQNAVHDTRECLLKMYGDGPLHCKYIIEDNQEL